MIIELWALPALVLKKKKKSKNVFKKIKSKMGEQKGKEQGRREKEKGFSKGKASNSPTTVQKSVLALSFEMWA